MIIVITIINISFSNDSVIFFNSSFTSYLNVISGNMLHYTCCIFHVLVLMIRNFV